MDHTVNEEQEELIKTLKSIAMANYEDGGDTFIECYDDEAWLRFIDGRSPQFVEDHLRQMMKIRKERERAAAW